jgi:hypothetical protein
MKGDFYHPKTSALSHYLAIAVGNFIALIGGKTNDEKL